MSARGRARRNALETLYAAEVRGQSPVDYLEQEVAERVTNKQEPFNPYTVELVRGVDEHRERIDELIAQHARGWTLARMPAVDRNALRLGAYELVWLDDVPDHVAVSEAMALVRDLSTDDSPSFVNGVLEALKRNKPDLGS